MACILAVISTDKGWRSQSKTKLSHLKASFEAGTIDSANMKALANFEVLLMTTALLLPSISRAQQEIGCFVQGECLDSFFVGITSVDTPEACLGVCLVRLLNQIIFCSFKDFF